MIKRCMMCNNFYKEDYCEWHYFADANNYVWTLCDFCWQRLKIVKDRR